MKQRDFFLRTRIDGDGSIRLVPIARRARKTQIPQHRLSTCRAWHDMLEFKDGNRQIFCRPAIGTAVCEVVANLAAEIGGDVNAHAPGAPDRWRSVYLARVLRIVS
jgi:hypothetical protein